MSVTRVLEWALVDTHLWVSTAAAGLSLFACAALGLPLAGESAGIAFSATMLIYGVDDVFDGRASAQPLRWVTVAVGAFALGAQLLAAPLQVVILVVVGACPALLYGAPVLGVRLRDLPGAKPFFVAASLTTAAICVPTVWAAAVGLHVEVGAIGATFVVLFILTLCNVCFFDVRDRRQDGRDGVGTIPVCFGVGRTRQICLLLSGAVAAIAMASPLEPAWPILLAAAATASYSRWFPAGSRRLSYCLVVDGVPVLLGLSCWFRVPG